MSKYRRIDPKPKELGLLIQEYKEKKKEPEKAKKKNEVDKNKTRG